MTHCISATTVAWTLVACFATATAFVIAAGAFILYTVRQYEKEARHEN